MLPCYPGICAPGLEVCHLFSLECILLKECAGKIQVAAFRKFIADLGQFLQNEGTERQGPMNFKSVVRSYEKGKIEQTWKMMWEDLEWRTGELE